MSISKLKAKKMWKLQTTEARGSFDDPQAQLEGFYAIHADFTSSFNEKTAEEKTAFIDHFNALLDNEESNLGTLLASGSLADLKFEVGSWDSEDIEKTMKELADLGYIEIPDDE